MSSRNNLCTGASEARRSAQRWRGLAVSLLLIAPLMVAGTQKPEEVVRSGIEGLRQAVLKEGETLDRDPERMIDLLRTHIEPRVDKTIFARLILGSHWTATTPEQRAAFTATFSEVLLRVYGVHAGEYADARIEYLGTTPVTGHPNVVVVRTDVFAKAGRPATRVDYRLVSRDSAWKVIDAAVDGISIARTYRAALHEEIRQFGVDKVIERMAQQSLDRRLPLQR